MKKTLHLIDFERFRNRSYESSRSQSAFAPWPGAAERRRLRHAAGRTLGAGALIGLALWPWAMPGGPAGAAFAVASARAEPGKAACPRAGFQNAVVAKIDARLDLALSDGRSLHLAGIDPPRATPTAPNLPIEARDAFAAALRGGKISLWPLAATPDRWGRIPAFVFFRSRGSAGPPVSAATFLLAHGLARFMPVPAAHACRDEFLAAEARARNAGLGLWRDPYYAIIDARDRAAFAGKAATNIIVQGRLAAVHAGRYRMRLIFAPKPNDFFSVTILQRNVATIERSGLNFRALIGRLLRVRGLLDLRFGPHIEITSADDIEVLTNGQKQGRTVRATTPKAAPVPTRDP